jgi:hypothetical protein
VRRTDANEAPRLSSSARRPHRRPGNADYHRLDERSARARISVLAMVRA